MKIYVPDYMVVPVRDMVAELGEAAKKELAVMSAKRSLTAEQKWEQCAPILTRITMAATLYDSLNDAVANAAATPEPAVPVEPQGNGAEVPAEADAEGDDGGGSTTYVTQPKDAKPAARTRPETQGDGQEPADPG